MVKVVWLPSWVLKMPLRECCDSVEGVVTAANYNAPGQVVIAGESAAVDSAIAACKGC